MAIFNTKIKRSRATKNLAGGKAFSRSPESELIHAVLTTFLDDKYYESKEDRMERLQSLIERNNPEFVAKLAVVARKEFHLRSVSHLLLGELLNTVRGNGIIKNAIVASAERPDDLTEIASYVGLPFPKQLKRGVRNAFLKFDRYSLAKYRGEGKRFSLVDLFNLTHPKAQHASLEQREAWDDLVNGALKSDNQTWESVQSAIGSSDFDDDTKEEAKTKAWEDMVIEGKLGYMALLRNLNNLVKSDVSDKAIKAAVKQITDPQRIEKSKQLPFRFFTAYKQVNGNRLLTDAISEAMDIAVSNAPEFDGKTLIAVDVSGSMCGNAAEKAGIFAATLAKANKDADIVLFDTKRYEFNVSSRLPVVDIVQKMKKYGGGGTETSLVFDTDKVYDRIIILSDEESWVESSWGNYSVQKAFSDYKNRTGADPFVYAIDIQGYGTSDIKGDRVYHFCGFSDRLLDFMHLLEVGVSLTDYIRHYDIPEIPDVFQGKKRDAKPLAKTRGKAVAARKRRKA